MIIEEIPYRCDYTHGTSIYNVDYDIGFNVFAPLNAVNNIF